MGVRWPTYKLRLSLILYLLNWWSCYSLNPEGLALLDFRAGVSHDPYGAFISWNPDDLDPCSWANVHCVDGNVQVLDLKGLSLEGVLSPEIGNLKHLRRLILSHNQFSGAIPIELGELKLLEVLDLTDNNLSGHIPSEFGRMHSLKRLLLCNNKLEGSIPMELKTLNCLYEMHYDENLLSLVTDGIGCLNRKFGRCIWQGVFKHHKKTESLLIQIKVTANIYLNPLQLFRKSSSDDCSIPEKLVELEPEKVQNVVRRKLAEESPNLAAAPSPNDGIGPPKIIALPTSRSSGSFPAVPMRKEHTSPPPSNLHKPKVQETPENSGEPPTNQPPEEDNSEKWKVLVIIISCCLLFLIIIAIALWCVCRSRAVKTIAPWRTGISGQLQKAFVTGVPQLNRTELETACEDFSNIIQTTEGYTLYKGTLSSGVEICVASTTISSLKDWSKRSELAFRKKIDALSRVNHKNFVNLVGYCEEDEPFARMMVFEYAPNGSLSEHLHVKELEHLDWSSRMRIIMGTAYCVQYMHELNPPVPHTNLTSTFICLTDDYAPKVAEMGFWKDLISKPKDSESVHSALPPPIDTETNVYSFGVLMLEIITGKLPYSDHQGPLAAWVAQYLDKRNTSDMVDPTLESFKQNELKVVCEVIEECIQQDARKRPTMEEVVTKLREVLRISPEQAIPRLSPLWWAELEILSGEAA